MNDEKISITQVREETGERLLKLTSAAVDALEELIKDSGANPAARVQAAEVVFNRVLGKPEESIRIEASEAEFEEAQKRLEAIFAMVDDEDK